MMDLVSFQSHLDPDDKGWYITKQKLNTKELYSVAKDLFTYKNKPEGYSNFESYGKSKGLFTAHNYRKVRNILYLGLATSGHEYSDFEVSPAFKKLLSLEREFGINSIEFKNFFTNQTEKMYFPNSFSMEKDHYESLGYGIFPVIFTYKVFLTVFRETGRLDISKKEFKVLIASAKKYDDWKDRSDLLIIGNQSINQSLSNQFDGVRIQNVLEDLNYFNISSNSISLKKDRVEELQQKISIYENKRKALEIIIGSGNYEEWLASDEIVFPIETNTFPISDTDTEIQESENIQSVPQYYSDIDSIDQINNRIPVFTHTSSGDKVKTDPRLAKTAIVTADYKCECGNDHVSFTDKKGHNYVEAHHLIPIKAQKNIYQNLDRTENIVSLCPNCHKAIHLGNKDTREKILNILVTKRQALLSNVGLEIESTDSLLEKYYK